MKFKTITYCPFVLVLCSTAILASFIRHSTHLLETISSSLLSCLSMRKISSFIHKQWLKIHSPSCYILRSLTFWERHAMALELLEDTGDPFMDSDRIFSPVPLRHDGWASQRLVLLHHTTKLCRYRMASSPPTAIRYLYYSWWRCRRVLHVGLNVMLSRSSFTILSDMVHWYLDMILFMLFML